MNSSDEEKRFQEVLRKFKTRLKDPLRFEELFSILKLVFYAGLEKKEATNLKIGDILQGNEADQITLAPGGNPIQISEEVKSALLEYVWALQPWNMPSNSPLYPRYFGGSGRKSLDRYLKPFGKINFDRLRRAGVKHFYKMRQREVGDSEAKEEAGREFRLTKRTIEDILGDKTQPPGERPLENQPPSERLMDIREQQEWLSTSDILIDNKVPKLVDEYFKVLDEMKDEEFKSENERTQMKEKFLDDIIDQPLSWAVDKVNILKKKLA